MGRIVALDEHRRVVDGIAMRWLEPAAPGDRGGAAGSPAPSPAPPVVLVHGIPTSAELWRRVLPAVRGARPMAWEMVGYGASIPAGRGRDISVARQADYLLAWLDALGIRRAILVGHDLGAGVVLRVAVLRPGACAGLVLTNGVAYDAWPVWPVRLLRALHPVVRRVPGALLAPIFAGVLRRMHVEPETGAESARIHWGHYARHGAGEALARQARSLDSRDTRAIADRLPGIDTPARVLWGDADPFLPLALADRLARELGTEVRRLPGGSHFTPEDRPGPVVRAISELAAGLAGH